MAGLPCLMIRGGTSRGAYFHGRDLPSDTVLRDRMLVRVMGGPDALQIDGIGGGHPLTSKVAVVDPAQDDEADVDFLFLQIDPAAQTVSDVQNCGNILAGVGLFALAEGLVVAGDGTTVVRVRMLNSGALCHLEMPTPHGQIQTEGETIIDGVPGAGAPIVCNYMDVAGATCGAMLPTGGVVDVIDGVRVTAVDNGMPVVVLRAEDLGVGGNEAPHDLDNNTYLKAQLENIRLQIGRAMNLGDVTAKSVPKMCLVSKPTSGGLVMTRTFIPHSCHKTIGVLGAVSTATACLLPGSAVAGLAQQPSGNPKIVRIEHAAGALALKLDMDAQGNVRRAGVLRTGRLLFKGEVFV